MNGLDRFYADLTKAFVEMYLPATERHRSEIEESFANFLLGRESSQPTQIELSSSALFIREIHWGVFEIIGSYESLLDAETYIRRFPYVNTRITRIRHLKYIFENHLSDIYILKGNCSGC